MIPGNTTPEFFGAASASGGAYSISRSLRFNSADSAYLSRTPASAGNRKTWTWAGWVKRSGLGGDQEIIVAESGSDVTELYFTSDTIWFYQYNGSYQGQLITTQVFRDPSSWYHLVAVYDADNATASDRMRLYVNGNRITQFSTSQNLSSGTQSAFNSTYSHYIGARGAFGSRYLSGYLADIYFIDGQALTPSSFTETDATTGQLIPKAYSGTYTGNSFWLPFRDNSAATATTLGKDNFNLGNNWTPSNLSITAGSGNDSLVDVPTNGSQTDTGVGGEVRGNYAVLNPLRKAGSHTLSNGNLDIVMGSDSTSRTAFGSIGVSSGKWYWEALVNTVASVYYPGFGVNTNLALSPEVQSGDTAAGFMYLANGQKFNNGSLTSYGASYTNGDVVGVALDMDAGTITFYKNGSSQGQAFSGIMGTATPCAIGFSGGTSPSASFNFGQRAFAYTAPSGFKALCTANITTPLVVKPSTVMDVLTWTGTGGSRTFSGLGFSPDLIWGKGRSQAYNHQIYDIIRDTGASKVLMSNSTAAEGSANAALYGYISGFNSNGFATTAGTTDNSYWNELNTTYVAWTWDAGSSTVTNTAGSITGGAQVRANATAGFSAVTWTGTGNVETIGHGLGVAPSFIIIKRRNGATDWDSYHASLGNTKGIALNSTAAAGTGSGYWNNTSPTSTVFTVGTGVQANGGTYVAYCFAPVVGYSNFGSYTGNGNADGPFVYTGFRPRWLLIKQSSASGENWRLFDTSRDPYNVSQNRLLANLNLVEGIGVPNELDILSNGFKLRATDSASNGSGATYVYAAFAESPFNYARAR